MEVEINKAAEAEVQEIPELEESAAEEAGSLGVLFQEAQTLRVRLDDTEITTHRTLNEEYQAKTEELSTEAEALDSEEREILAGQNPEREAAQRHVYEEEIFKAQATGNAKAEAVWREKITALDEKNQKDTDDLQGIQTRRQEINAECKRIAGQIWSANYSTLHNKVLQYIAVCLDRIQAIKSQAQRFCDEHNIQSNNVGGLARVSSGGRDRHLRKQINEVFG